MPRNLGIGIDTGGTYTDACLYDFSTHEVLRSAKARTTYHDLSEGVNAAVAALNDGCFPQVEIISLSTTLATNAMVEGRGGRESLLLLGYQQDLMEQLSPEVGLLLHKHVFYIPGSIDILGKETAPLDLAAARKAILSVQHEVDAIGVSGYLSVINPAHELAVKKLVQELTTLPVTCGHELTNEMHSVKRAATVALNARLIPIIRQLIQSVQYALREQGIDAPLVVVQGNGSLVRAEVAMQQPVQTILSGPAASCVGGATLSGELDCIAVDTGGTTSDIALLRNGRPELDPRGASVGNWRTSIAAVNARTTGLGGDSHVRITKQLDIEIGPQRVIPLSVAADNFPNLMEEIEHLARAEKGLALTQVFDFLCLQKPQAATELSGNERLVAQALADGPLSLTQLASTLELVHPLLLDTRRLEQLGIVARIGLTPTDILHAAGRYNLWDSTAARTAVAATADMLSLSTEAFISTVGERISRRLALEILSKLAGMGASEPVQLSDCPACVSFVDLGFGAIQPETRGGLRCHFSLDYPLIALGAPGGVYLQRAAEMLGAKLIVPRHGEVANAVGAITSHVVCAVTCTVTPEYSPAGVSGYYLTGLTDNTCYTDLPTALDAARELAALEATKRATDAGANEIRLQVDSVKVGEKVYLGTKVTATAIGLPSMRSGAAESVSRA